MWYPDYSNAEYENYAILKSSKGYVIAYPVQFRRHGKVQVSLGAIDTKHFYEDMYQAMKALRNKANHELPVEKEVIAVEQALKILGIAKLENSEQVTRAFRALVKQAADGKGGYTGDMDLLVKSKEAVLSHLLSASEN